MRSSSVMTATPSLSVNFAGCSSFSRHYRTAHTAFSRAHHISQYHVVMTQQALLNLGAPHHAAGGNLFEGFNQIGRAAFFSLIKAAKMGRAKASPTITKSVTRWSSTIVSSLSGFSPSLEVCRHRAAKQHGRKLPSQTPVPCISGQAGKLIGGSSICSRKSLKAARFSGG